MTSTAAARRDARVLLVEHPLVADRVTRLRDEATAPPAFRQLLGEVAALVCYEALGDLRTATEQIRTPVALLVDAPVVSETVLLVPVLRAGLGMVPAIQSLLPHTEVAHVGLRRDEESLHASVYLDRLPARLEGRRVVVLDPMLATGGSLVQVCSMLKARGASDVTALCIIASRPGLAHVAAAHPDVLVACAAIDEVLDARGYITPGLGDAGDRLFGPPPDGA